MFKLGKIQKKVGVLLAALMLFMLHEAQGREEQKISSKSSIHESSSSHLVVQGKPVIAVTDLSFEEKVKSHFIKYDLHTSNSSNHSSDAVIGSRSSSSSGQSERTEHLETGTDETIDRGELRKFTADIKGEMLKSGQYKLSQGKPWVKKETDNLFDIIERIKEGYYPNADFVLFGSVNSVDFRNESNPIQGSNAVNYSLSLELVAEFSLINTKTFEVVASFSAMGEGSDSKLLNLAGQTYVPSKSKAVRELSKSLGRSVNEQLIDQFSPNSAAEITSESRSESVEQETEAKYR